MSAENEKLINWIDHQLGEHFAGFAVVGFKRDGGPESGLCVIRHNDDQKTLIGLRVLLASAAQQPAPPSDEATV